MNLKKLCKVKAARENNCILYDSTYIEFREKKNV